MKKRELFDEPAPSIANRYGGFRESKDDVCIREEKQHRRTHSVSRASGPLTLLNKGNSDPFNAATMDITPAINELLCLASEFYVFWAWPINSSAIYFRKAKEDWMKEIRDSLSHEAHFHVILAKGTYVKERPPAMVAAKDVERGLMYKTRAMSCLRQGLCEAAPGAANAVLMTILRLLSLEFYVGNFHAAAMHHSAARQFIHSHEFPGWHDPATFAIADVWVASALLRPPSSSPKSWDPGPWSSQPQCKSTSINGRFSATLDERIVPCLRDTFYNVHEVVTIRTQLGILTESERFQVVCWIDARSAAIKATVLEQLTDITATHPGLRTTDGNLIAPSCMIAVVLFMNIIFLFSDDCGDNDSPRQLMPSNILHAGLERLRKYLTQLLQQADRFPEPSDHGVLTWLVFIGAFGSHIGDGPSASRELRQAFVRLCSGKPLRGQQSVRELLSGFLFDAAIMDPYLSTILDTL